MITFAKRKDGDGLSLRFAAKTGNKSIKNKL